MKIITLLTILSAICFLSASAQYRITYSREVYESPEIIFYGYDFQKLKLAETSRMTENMTPQIFAWIEFCQKEITSQKIASWFRKQKVTSDFSPVVEQAKKIAGTEVVTHKANTLERDSLQTIISSYPLTQTEGIGFVIILECFDKPSKMTSGYFTFFDIARRKVLIADYFSGREADGSGLTNYWGTSLIGTTKQYAAKYRDFLKGIK